MDNFCLLKQDFLKKWIEGLKECSSSSKNMGILERKNAIKLSADLAMAFARKGRTSWSRAVIAKASHDHQSSNNGPRSVRMIKKASKQRQFQSKKITKRSRSIHREMLRNKSSRSYRKVLPNSIAKRLVQKRTQVLKHLVPGSDQCVDEVSLFKETLDYMISLQAQVDVMRSCLARASIELVNDK